ncbi:MAG: response regulator [Acetobacteraceae bacterium]|nr:response regulator [Acetobacteraceae bacterium]MBV8591461.1 response regulator [Acetobacteraceae bacterium]
MTSEPTIHILDDDEAVRDSLQLMLEAAGYRTRSWVSGRDLVAALPGIEPGCLLLDVRMPGMDGVAVLGRVRQSRTGLPVIMITGHGDVPLAVKAMKAGAADFIEKPFTQEAIMESIQTALAHTEAEGPHAEAAARISLLSVREKQVFEGVIAGLSNKSIAHDLGISPRTVEIHRARVMEKMQARSLSELVRLGLAAGV